MKIFNKDFQGVNTDTVVSELLIKGYFCFPNAVTDVAISAIERDATQSRFSLNKNEVSGVFSEKQYYLTNLLSISKTFYEFATSKLVFDICYKYLGNSFRLKALRYYETYGGHHMQWHTDNKTDRGFASIPGIIFIVYVSDVSDGQFQYIEGSHLWSGEKAYSDYSDQFIEDNYKTKIKDFRLPSGSLIIYNTYGIHRAKPVFNDKFVRKSVFFQVDNEVENSEPIILNAKFITQINSQIEMFLGFGKPCEYRVYPNTSINTLPFSKDLLIIFINYIIHRCKRNLLPFFPQYLKDIIKRVVTFRI